MFVVCNPSQTSPSLAIFVSLGFIFVGLTKQVFSAFFQFQGNFVPGQLIRMTELL